MVKIWLALSSYIVYLPSLCFRCRGWLVTDKWLIVVPLINYVPSTGFWSFVTLCVCEHETGMGTLLRRAAQRVGDRPGRAFSREPAVSCAACHPGKAYWGHRANWIQAPTLMVYLHSFESYILVIFVFLAQNYHCTPLPNLGKKLTF